MPKTTIDYVIRVHTLPEDLRPPFPEEREHLGETSAIYRIVIESGLLWKVWMIDEFGQVWIEVNIENEDGQPEFHTLVIDEGTHRKVECDPYEIVVEAKNWDG